VKRVLNVFSPQLDPSRDAFALPSSVSRRDRGWLCGRACRVPHSGPDVAVTPPTEQLGSDLEQLVDGLVETSLDEYDVPGASVAVVADGSRVVTKGHGVADRATESRSTTRASRSHSRIS